MTTPDTPEPRTLRDSDEIYEAAREHYRKHLAHKVTPAHAERMGALLAESGLLRRREEGEGAA